MAKTSPAKFVREVRQEGSKVTWPTRKETAVTTGMVMVMTLITALFFLLVDQLISVGVGALLGIGS
ncbi:MAG: preprotein translocase subunit SecE [Alphaproteobacteria bacterium]|jgi:preprotein translocase subunit SecE